MTAVLTVGAAFAAIIVVLGAATALNDGIEALVRRWRS